MLVTATTYLKLNQRDNQTTLEEMLLQLDMEEKMARREKLNEYGQHRMSLDGKDAMYRSSFHYVSTSVDARKSVCCNRELRKMEMKTQTQNMPPAVAGERVVWCKPGVVAKLIGLEAMPISIHRKHSKDRVSAIIKSQSLRIRAKTYEMESKRRGRVSCGGHNWCVKRGMNNQNVMSSFSRNGNGPNKRSQRSRLANARRRFVQK